MYCALLLIAQQSQTEHWLASLVPHLASKSSCSCRRCRGRWGDWRGRAARGDRGRCPSSCSAASRRPPASSSSAGSAAWWRSSWRPAAPPCSSSCSATRTCPPPCRALTETSRGRCRWIQREMWSSLCPSWLSVDWPHCSQVGSFSVTCQMAAWLFMCSSRHISSVWSQLCLSFSLTGVGLHGRAGVWRLSVQPSLTPAGHTRQSLRPHHSPRPLSLCTWCPHCQGRNLPLVTVPRYFYYCGDWQSSLLSSPDTPGNGGEKQSARNSQHWYHQLHAVREATRNIWSAPHSVSWDVQAGVSISLISVWDLTLDVPRLDFGLSAVSWAVCEVSDPRKCWCLFVCLIVWSLTESHQRALHWLHSHYSLVSAAALLSTPKDGESCGDIKWQ